MNLKFREVDDKYKVLSDEDLAEGIKIKPFLTIAELNTIVSDLKENSIEELEDGTKKEKAKSAIARHFGKIIFLTDFCTNLDLTGMTPDDVYDLASELGLIEVFQIYLYEYNEIDNLIKADESIYNVVKEISDNLTPQINEVMSKIGDGTGLFDKLKGLIGNGNK